MITEQEALNALKTWNDRGEDYIFASLVVAEWARQELARREAERAERAKPIDAEWLESLPRFRRGAEYISTRIHCIDIWFHIKDACLGIAGLRKPHITTRGQLIDIINGLKGVS